MINTALITGSTRGIGRAYAEKLAGQGYNLILVSRNGDKLCEQAIKVTERYGTRVDVISADLAKPDAAKYVFNSVLELGLSIDVLINNAGFNEYGSFLDTEIDNENKMISLHITFTTEMMKYFTPQMVEKKIGYILNLGSTGSFIPCPNDAVYAATKAYIISVSKGVNAELKGTGVSVTTLCPGSTKTDFAIKAGMENTLLFKLFVMEPETVAEIGYRAMKKRKTTVVAGVYNKILVFSAKILPEFIVNSLTRWMLMNSN